jgi:hypothetical protein
VSAKNNGGAAFPRGNAHCALQDGMSLRDYFAAQALAGYVDEEGNPYNESEIAEWCYKVADAMLAERSRG